MRDAHVTFLFRDQAAEEALEQMDLETFAATSIPGDGLGERVRREQGSADDHHAIDAGYLEERRRELAGEGQASGTVRGEGDEMCGGGLTHVDAQTNQPTMVNVQVSLYECIAALHLHSSNGRSSSSSLPLTPCRCLKTKQKDKKVTARTATGEEHAIASRTCIRLLNPALIPPD